MERTIFLDAEVLAQALAKSTYKLRCRMRARFFQPGAGSAGKSQLEGPAEAQASKRLLGIKAAILCSLSQQQA